MRLASVILDIPTQALENAYSFHDFGGFLNHEPGFPGGLDGIEFACNAGDPGREDPLE